MCPRSDPGTESPPRMRGKVARTVKGITVLGITPAYAGKRRLCVVAAHLGRDHPRVCGEKRDFSRLPPFLQGSPPRMRGKGFESGVSSIQRGITPAYAGKSRPYIWVLVRLRDHPRVCGEKNHIRIGDLLRTGSPPRMRGKEVSKRLNSTKRRITPAYAGKRVSIRQAVVNSRDHPRVCGEKTKKIP